jgi:hypothetical protein
MRLPFFSRQTDEHLAAAARNRVALLVGAGLEEDHSPTGGTRVGGWVPRAPDRVLEQLSDEHGSQLSVEHVSAPDGDQTAGETVDRRAHLSGGRHVRSSTSAAVIDRLPLALRALWEQRALGRFRTELGRGQLVVVCLVLLAGLAVAAVV